MAALSLFAMQPFSYRDSSGGGIDVIRAHRQAMVCSAASYRRWLFMFLVAVDGLVKWPSGVICFVTQARRRCGSFTRRWLRTFFFTASSPYLGILFSVDGTHLHVYFHRIYV